MTVSEVREVMRRMWAANADVLACIYRAGAPDLAPLPGTRAGKAPIEAEFRDAYRMFFLSVLPVPPNRVRPPSRLGEIVYEHPYNTSLQKARRTDRFAFLFPSTCHDAHVSNCSRHHMYVLSIHDNYA